ncbi:hypothetical protein S245_072394, partial [Arachis hypogaea]
PSSGSISTTLETNDASILFLVDSASLTIHCHRRLLINEETIAAVLPTFVADSLVGTADIIIG